MAGTPFRGTHGDPNATLNGLARDGPMALLSFVIALAIACIAGGKYLVAPMLVGDDTFILPAYMTDPASILLEDGPTHRFFSMLGKFGHPFAFRLPALLAYAMCPAILYLLLRACGLSRWLAMLSALTSCVTAVFPRQIVFVTGSHPITGAFLSLSALLFAVLTERTDGRHRVELYLASLGALVLAAFMSSIYSVAPLVLPVWLALTLFSRPGHVSPTVVAALTVAALGAIAARLAVSASYHPYLLLEGWRDPTLVNILDRLESLVQHCVRADRGYQHNRLVLSPAAYLIAAFVMAAALIGFFMQLRQRYATFDSNAMEAHWRVPVALLALSVFTFAPSSVLTFFTDRYALAPWLFAVAGIFGFAASCLSRPGMRYVGATVLAVLPASLPLKVNSLIEGQRLWLEPHVDFHEAMVDVATRGATEWKKGASVVVFLRETDVNPTAGYPHYSTGYMRYVSGRSDVIALIGSAGLADAWPFVPKIDSIWAKTEGYWYERNGRSVRAKLVGLDASRPIYAYERDSDRTVSAIRSLVFLEDDQIRIVNAGREYASATAASAANGVCVNGSAGYAVWPFVGGGLDALVDGWRSQSGANAEVLLSDSPLHVASDPGERLLAQIELVSAPAVSTDATVFSSPILSLHLDHDGSIAAHSATGAPLLEVRKPWRGLQLTIWGRQDCGMLWGMQGRLRGILRADISSGPWYFDPMNPDWTATLIRSRSTGAFGHHE